MFNLSYSTRRSYKTLAIYINEVLLYSVFKGKWIILLNYNSMYTN